MMSDEWGAEGAVVRTREGHVKIRGLLHSLFRLLRSRRGGSRGPEPLDWLAALAFVLHAGSPSGGGRGGA
jgi:hypothetical protein